jgi:hypothetical protein
MQSDIDKKTVCLFSSESKRHERIRILFGIEVPGPTTYRADLSQETKTDDTIPKAPRKSTVKKSRKLLAFDRAKSDSGV